MLLIDDGKSEAIGGVRYMQIRNCCSAAKRNKLIAISQGELRVGALCHVFDRLVSDGGSGLVTPAESDIEKETDAIIVATHQSIALAHWLGNIGGDAGNCDAEYHLEVLTFG